jgi:nitrate reductase NapE component
MSRFLGGYADLVIAGGLVLIAIVVFLLSRMGLLPKKSIPIVAGALVGAFGIVIWRQRRTQIMRARLEELEKELKIREGKVKQLRDGSLASETELRKAQAELSAQRTALQQSILQVDARTKEERERIDRLDTNEVADEFVRRFGNEPVATPAGLAAAPPVAPPAGPAGPQPAGRRPGP